MWPFKKKRKLPPLDGPWLVAEGKHNDAPMFVRTNTGYSEFSPVAQYDYRVGIAIPLQESTANGLPGMNEGALLGEIEDILCSSLEEQALALFVAVITTSGMREFVFYTRDPLVIEQRIVTLREQITSHETQWTIQPDNDWIVYSQLM